MDPIESGQRPSERSPVWVVIPTYNEAAGIEALVEAVTPKLPERHRFLIVDDSSPDGTGRIADRLVDERDDLEVLHRPVKLGLGPAYLAGFRRALDAGAQLIVQMDADFSHDPAYLPRLLAASETADLVIGSRYVEGGGVTDWGLLRRAVSRAGCTYSKLGLGVGINDLTGGFKCFRREVLESIDMGSVTSIGYAFQIEMNFRAIKSGFEVIEVPITFRERRAGNSKMTGAIAAEAAWRVPAMRLKSALGGRA